MSLDGEAQDNSKEKARPGSHAKERSSFKVTTLIVIPLLAIVIPAIVAIYIAKTSGGASDSQPQGSTPSKSAPSSPSPSQQGLTIDQVKGALLTPSDLASIDSNLASADVTFPVEGSCKGWVIKPVFNLNRELSDVNNPIIGDGVAIFNSPGDAHTVFAENARMTCAYTKIVSASNISSGLRGICDERSAWMVKSKDNGPTVSSYRGEIRCGRAIVSFALAAPPGSSFIHNYIFYKGIKTAVPKVLALLQRPFSRSLTSHASRQWT